MIVDYIRGLFGICPHQWVIAKEIEVHGPIDWVGTRDRVAIVYVQKCSKCGAIKTTKVKG